MTITVLIASRTEIYAEGIKKLLEDDERLCLCGIACNQEDFAEMLKTGPDVVVADQALVSNSVIPPASKLLLIYDRPSFSVSATTLQGLIAKGLAGILVNNK
jgi:DNA-binding NarL/FixJ family response regulator